MTNGITKRLPTYFLSHGGGPWPYMKKELGGAFDKLEESLINIAKELPHKPQAILMVSAHWIEPDFSLMSNPQPPMLYDFSGFPNYTYKVKYSAPGAPALADQVKGLLEAAGISTTLNATRGFDHGMYSVLYPMYPEADVPVIQLSLKQGLDPESHLKAGQALSALRDEGVLIVGSGYSFHNLRLMWQESAGPISKKFDDWLQETLTAEPEERVKSLLLWRQAPLAQVAHPPGGEDHFLPLLVALGAAWNESSSCVYYENTGFPGYITASSFRFGQLDH